MYAQRIKTFLVKDPQVREIVGENYLGRAPSLREPLPALWVEDVSAAAGEPAKVRLHVFADVYQQAKSLIRLIVRVLDYFEDTGPALAMETDDFSFHPVNGRVKLPGDRIRFELTQDLDVTEAPAEPAAEG